MLYVGSFSKTRAPLAAPLAAALAGAALLSLPAWRLRVDQVTCTSWPSPPAAAALAVAYVGAVALLAVGWRAWWMARPRLGHALGAGLAVHVVALAAPPFLSRDPLFYAAVGRAMARYHASPYRPLAAALPADDALLRALGPDWQAGTSAYFPGWNQLARAVAWLGGDRLDVVVRLHQAIGLVALVAAAALVGLAVRRREPERAGSAAAAVLLCPLAVIEATVSAHNDGLVALTVALFAWATVAARPLATLAAVALGLAVKASALLVAGLGAIAWLVGRLRPTAQKLLVAGLAVAAVAVAVAAWRGPALVAAAARFTALVDTHTLLCDRALECIPRWLLWRRRHTAAAVAVGLVVRAVGAAWLLFCAVRAGRERRLLPWLATAIFVYYLYFHAYVQAWYLLPLLPLLPFASARVRPALAAACVTWLGHYAVLLPLNCRASSAQLWLERAAGLALVLLVPTALLLRRGYLPQTLPQPRLDVSVTDGKA